MKGLWSASQKPSPTYSAIGAPWASTSRLRDFVKRYSSVKLHPPRLRNAFTTPAFGKSWNRTSRHTLPVAKQNRDIGTSIRSRLLKLARERGQAFDLLLTRFVLERLLYRLSMSAHRDKFVLKGAMLVTTWFADSHQPTRDDDDLRARSVIH